MDPDNILFIGAKSRVYALSRDDGVLLWSTGLPQGMGASPVTLVAAGRRVFAHGDGRTHCLDSATGEILWSNDLPGCGPVNLALSGGASAAQGAKAEESATVPMRSPTRA